MGARLQQLHRGSVYHPLRPLPLDQPTEQLLDYIEACAEEASRDFPTAHIVLAGDLNKLSEHEVVERTGLTQIVHQPTRDANILDRVYVSDPQLYSTVHVVTSVVKSDHKAVSSRSPTKTNALSPRQHFSEHLAMLDVVMRISGYLFNKICMSYINLTDEIQAYLNGNG